MFSGLLFRLVGFGQDGQSQMKKILIQAGGTVVQFGADFNILPILMDFSLQSSAAHGKFVSELYIKGDTFKVTIRMIDLKLDSWSSTPIEHCQI